MIKKLFLPLTALVLALNIQTAKSQSCNFSISENISDSTNSHLPSLITCYTYTVAYTIKNNGGSLTCPVTLAINLPDQITIDSANFHSTSSNGDTIQAHSFANSSIPYFIVNGLSNWNTNDSITIYFTLKTACCMPLTNSGHTFVSVDTNRCADTVGGAITVVAPVLSATNIYPGSHLNLAENIGSVMDLVFKIKNSGIYPINQYVNTVCPPESSLTMLGYFFSNTMDTTSESNKNFCNYYRSPNFVAGTYSVITADSSIYDSLFGAEYFPVDSMYLHIIYEISGCTMTSTPDTFILYCSNGTGSASCFPGVPVTSSITVVAGIPLVSNSLLQPVYINPLHANYCNGGDTSVRLGMVFTNKFNDNSGGAKGNARAEKFKIYLFTTDEIGVLDTSQLFINGFHYAWPSGFITKIPEVGTTEWRIDFTKWHWSCTDSLPFGPNSIADLNGDGLLDDLSDSTGQNTITISVDFKYATTCPATFMTHCGNTTDFPLRGNSGFQNQCNTLPNVDTSGGGAGYSYNVLSGNHSQLNLLSGHDIVAGTTSYFQFCPGTNKQEWADTGYRFICPRADHRIVVNLPPGYNVDFSDPLISGDSLANYVYLTSTCGCPLDSVKPVIKQDTNGCISNQAIIDFGLLPKCSCGDLYRTYDVSCFTIPISLRCNSCTSSSRGWDNITYSLDYYCDTSTCLSCYSQITCASNVAFHHCSGGCSSIGNDFNSYLPFTFRRQTLGWLNTKPANYYDECNNPPTYNVDSVAAVDPTIRLDRAYPGDEILAADSGTLDNSFSNYDSVLFQLNYTVALWTGRFGDTNIFNFDPTLSSMTVISSNHKTSVLKFPNLQHPFDRIDTDGKVQMSFTFSADSTVDTALKGMIPPYSFLARIYLIAKTTPVVYNYPIIPAFFDAGAYPVNDLQAEFRGTYDTNSHDTNNSCDPWTANFTMLQPSTTVSVFHGGYSTCDELTEILRVISAPALYPSNDFPHEFRPWAVLENNFRLLPPTGYTFDSANFYMVQDKYDSLGINNFTLNDTLKNYYDSVTPTLSLDTLIFNGPNHGCLPILDCKSFNGLVSDYYLTSYFTPLCNAPDTSYFSAYTGYTTSVQQGNTLYQDPYSNVFFHDGVIRQNPQFTLSLPSSSDLCTDSITFSIELLNTSGSVNAPYTWIALEQTDTVTPPLTFVRASNAIYTDTYGSGNMFIMLDSINQGQHRIIQVTVKLDTTNGFGCLDTFLAYPINVVYGNVCSNTSHITEPNTNAGCQFGSSTYTFNLHPSALSLSQKDSTFVDTLFCGNYLKYTFEISNYGGNTLYQPSFIANLPAGVGMDSVTFTYPDLLIGAHYSFIKDDSLHTTGNLIWNFTHDIGLSAGLPGTCFAYDSNNDILATVYLYTNCNFNNSIAPISFSSTGVSPCGKTIFSDTVSDHPTIPTSNCPSVTIHSTNDSCNGTSNGAAWATVTGGRLPYTYVWMPVGSSSDTITGLTVGTYTVTVTDSKGCIVVDSVTITQPNILIDSMYIISNINCITGTLASASTKASGGTTPYTYLWSPIGQTGDTATGLSNGTYTVTITDKNGCSLIDSISIEALTARFKVIDTLSCGTDSGFAVIIANGGTPPYTYLWSNANTTQIISGLTAGSYSVVVTDSLGCQATDSLTVTGCFNCYAKSNYDTVLINPHAKTIGAPYYYGWPYKPKILIEGTFTVDTNFSFLTCDVSLAPGALINIVDSSTLDIQIGGFLHAACDSMWRGIFIHPGSSLSTNDDLIIQDADTAIYTINKGTVQGYYNCYITTFNKDYKDIVVSPFTGNYESKTNNCLSTCRNFDSILSLHHFVNPIYGLGNWGTSPFDSLLPPHSGERTYMGWEIDSVKNFNEDSCRGNSFDNMRLGIYGINSNMNIYGDYFLHINEKSFKFPAIYDLGDSLHNTTGDILSVGGKPNDSNTFIDCTTGVFAKLGFLTVFVSNNRFHFEIPPTNGAPHTIGVISAGLMYPKYRLTIDSNTIDSAQIGIMASKNKNANAQIRYNFIEGGNRCFPVQEQGIRLSELISPTAIYSMKNNTIQNLHYGIYANGIVSDTIYQDTIRLGGDTNCHSPTAKAIYINSGSQAQIVDNTVSMPYHSNPADYLGLNFTGIYVANSPNCKILCNTTYNLNTAINCFGSGDIGPVFDVLGNRMTAGPNTLNSTGIYLQMAPVIGIQGLVTAPSDNQWLDTTNFTCRSNAPSPTVPALSPFHIRVGTTYNPDGGSCTVQIVAAPGAGLEYPCTAIPPVVLHSRAVLDSIATNQMTYQLYPDTTARISKGALTGILWNDGSLLSNPVLQNFNDSINNVSLGQLMIADTILTSNSAYDPSNLLANVNAITPASNVEANMQTAAQINLQAEVAKTDNLSPTQLYTARTLANLCPNSDGIGVYQARTLLDYYDTAFTVYDNDDCMNDDNRHHPDKNTKTNITDSIKNVAFNLYPNPNNGNFTLAYDLGSENLGKVEIYDQIGVKIVEYLLSSSMGKMQISNPNLSQGLYIYKLYTNSGVKKVGKIVIIK